MKLNPDKRKSSTQSPISDIYKEWVHPWYEYENGCARRSDQLTDITDYESKLIKPNPPSKESVRRAKFVDKTYHRSGPDSVRLRNKRSDS